MEVKDFLANACACGGNWTAMIMTGIKYNFPDAWRNLPADKEYSYEEVINLAKSLGVDFSSKTTMSA